MVEEFTNQLEGSMKNLYKQGAFLTVKRGEEVNTMTISWGSIGYMWRKPMFMALVRESRYSNEFLVDGSEYTISIPEIGEMKNALAICGSKSGKDTNKEEAANITFINSKAISTPVVDGCSKYYECKVVLKQEMDFSKLDKEIVENFYNESQGGKHILYFGEIVESYNK